jgi:hypothetical protein
MALHQPIGGRSWNCKDSRVELVLPPEDEANPATSTEPFGIEMVPVGREKEVVPSLRDDLVR